MKIKTYTASCLAEAMAAIRRDFGSDALILSNQHVSDGVRVTVGAPEKVSEEEIEEALFGPKEEQVLQVIRRALTEHRVPDILIDRLLVSSEQAPGQEAQELLTYALERTFHFMPLPATSSRRAFMLVGPSGCGKTIAVAKMAVKAKMAGRRVGVMTTDMKRAGAIEQLEAFTKILELDLVKIRKPAFLKAAVESMRQTNDLVIIDTPGVNPFLKTDMAFLEELKADIDGLEAILVLSAGGDAFETAEIAESFLRLGCKRILATRLDLSRRIGSLLFAAQNNGLSLSDVGISPHVSEGLCPLTPKALAELILLKEERLS